MKTSYEVVRTFYHRGQRLDPGPEGQPAVTILLTEPEARYLLLDGCIQTPQAGG